MDQPLTAPSGASPSAEAALASPVVELRQYTLKPGQRDTLMDLFEARFVDSQRALGIRLHGEFRDLNDANRFVWLRGFPSLEDRPRALKEFYYGDVWKANREVANATMVDSDNVLLLQPARKEGFSLARRMSALMVATVYLLRAPADEGFTRFFSERIEPVMQATGAPPVAELRTLYAPNNFPALPVREGENAFVWIAGYASRDEYQRHLARLSESKLWSAAEMELGKRLQSPPVVLELQPTPGTLTRNAMGYEHRLDHAGDLHDFDFLVGSWTGASRRLSKRGAGSHDWDTFPLEARTQSLLGGVVNAEEITFPTKHSAGVALRTFNAEKKQWAIYWVNARDGVLQAPVYGGFDGDVGLFYGDDIDAGRPVRAAFRWTRVGSNGARWEQAFSYDDGRSWETNWVMEFERATQR